MAQSTPEIVRGVAWLTAQVQPDGSLAGAAGSVSTPLQSSAETFHTLRLFGSVPPALLDNIVANAEDNTEYLARRIVATRAAGRDSSADLVRLVAKQNPDGGFGGDVAYSSNVLDTAYALVALNTPEASSTAALKAIAYLLKIQDANGAYSMGQGGPQVHFTALASVALQSAASTLATETAFARANTLLLTLQQADGGWGNVVDTSLTQIAIAGTNSDSALQGLISAAILARQDKDGSWGQDPYVTALAIRALMAKSETGPPPPSSGTLTGKVTAGAMGTAVAGATVSITELTGTATVSDSAGRFTFASVPGGTYTILITAPAYLSKQLVTQVRTGMTTDVNITMAEPAGNGGTLEGVVRDSATNAGLGGALIAVTGANSASINTLVDGSYKLTGLVPGAVRIVASKAGYANSVSEATISAGSVLNFSPSLSLNSTTATLTALVVDSATNAPIAGVVATASPGPLSGVTGADGRITIAGIGAGNTTVHLASSGYQPLSFSYLSEAGVNVDAQTIKLVKTNDNPPPTTATVRGVVTDAESALPLPGVALEITGAVTYSAMSANDGSYAVADMVPGAFVVKATKSGYTYAGASGSLAAGETRHVNPRMERVITPGVAGQVIDNDTLAPIAGAAVALDGVATTSDAAGRFLFANAPGGNHTLSLSHPGYTERKVPVTSFDSSLTDVQAIKLALSSKSMVLSGKVTDLATGQAIAKATVTVLGTSFQTVADAAGNYRIEGIPQGSVTVRYSGLGYTSETVILALSPYDTSAHDRALRAGGNSSLVLAVTTDKHSYAAYAPVAITAHVNNEGDEAIQATISVTIVDEQGNYLDSYVAQNASADGAVRNIYTFAGGATTPVQFAWNSRAHPPGQYFAVVRIQQVTEGGSAAIVELAQRRAGFAIDATEAISNVRLTPLPGYSNLGAIEQLAYRVELVNGSNVNVSSTLRYELLTPERAIVDSSTFAIDLIPAESSKVLLLTGPQYKFVASGLHEVVLSGVDGTVPLTLEAGGISIAPGTRIDAIQNVSPAIVTPDGDKRIQIDIRLQGIEQK